MIHLVLICSKRGRVQVGGEAWNAQQDALMRLAAHMHASVAAGSDELVKDALMLHGKLDTVVHLLLVFEVSAGP